MGLARPSAANQHDVAPAGQERAAKEAADQPLVDRVPSNTNASMSLITESLAALIR
jgi:hypothetical protein